MYAWAFPSPSVPSSPQQQQGPHNHRRIRTMTLSSLSTTRRVLNCRQAQLLLLPLSDVHNCVLACGCTVYLRRLVFFPHPERKNEKKEEQEQKISLSVSRLAARWFIYQDLRLHFDDHHHLFRFYFLCNFAHAYRQQRDSEQKAMEEKNKSCSKKNSSKYTTVVGRYVLPLRPSEYKYVVCGGRYCIIRYMRFICIIPSSGCVAIARGFLSLFLFIKKKKDDRNIWLCKEKNFLVLPWLTSFALGSIFCVWAETGNGEKQKKSQSVISGAYSIFSYMHVNSV